MAKIDDLPLLSNPTEDMFCLVGKGDLQKVPWSAIMGQIGAPYIATTVAGMTDKTRVYVYQGSESGYTSGNWYYWNGSAWTSGGKYNSAAVDTDKTLTQSDKPADSAVVGKEIGSLKEDIDNFPFQLIKSKNEFNSESVDNQDGKSLSDKGTVIDDSNYSVSHKIKCQYGDTVYLSRRINDISDERQFVTVWNICAYDSSDKFLGISTKGSYAVPLNTDYVRFNYWTTLAKTRKIMLSLNSDITYEE